MNNANKESDAVFKICPMCKTRWATRDSFLDDSLLLFNGYQANFGQLEQGVFFFTHHVDNCGSTMGLKVKAFTSLYSGPRYTTSRLLSQDCPSYCVDPSNLNRCTAKCENAFARELSQIIKNRMEHQKRAELIGSS